jgi:hypothetical protein
MTPEEIRAEAIELIARDRFARGIGLSGKTWDELPEWAATYLESAAHAVAAIDHLLPTGRQSQYLGIGRRRRHRYITDWTEDRA